MTRRPGEVGQLLHATVAGTHRLQERTMVSATTDDGQTLLALNEIYIGHRSHQTARYTVTTPDGVDERQASSGVVVATGTGATG